MQYVKLFRLNYFSPKVICKEQYLHVCTEKGFLFKHGIWEKSAVNLNVDVDEKAMIRNRYNRVPHLALNTKRERNTYNKTA